MKGFETFIVSDRSYEAGIVEAAVQGGQCFHFFLFFCGVKVRLVEENYYGDAVCFGRCQKSVGKGRGGFWVVEREDEYYLVKVCGQDVALSGEVGCFANDVVATFFNFADKGCVILVFLKMNVIAYSDGIGASYSFEAELAFDFTRYPAAVVATNFVPTAGILYYLSSQVLNDLETEQLRLLHLSAWGMSGAFSRSCNGGVKRS